MIKYPVTKTIKLTEDQRNKMQKTANKWFDGNMSALIRHMWEHWKGSKK